MAMPLPIARTPRLCGAAVDVTGRRYGNGGRSMPSPIRPRTAETIGLRAERPPVKVVVKLYGCRRIGAVFERPLMRPRRHGSG